jgi:hypothetical protein
MRGQVRWGSRGCNDAATGEFVIVFFVRLVIGLDDVVSDRREYDKSESFYGFV